jgi:hypothetical protein
MFLSIKVSGLDNSFPRYEGQKDPVLFNKIISHFFPESGLVSTLGQKWLSSEKTESGFPFLARFSSIFAFNPKFSRFRPPPPLEPKFLEISPIVFDNILKSLFFFLSLALAKNCEFF